nr:PAS domain S-box protein [uncultured Flavobacterium sp.]
MNKLEFNFSDDSFNRLFPFYILIDQSLQIVSFGKSLSKISPFIKTHTPFSDNFIIKRPHLENPTFDEITNNSNQLIIIVNKISGISLKGQFELINNYLLFVGSPWFSSMHEVVEKKLTLYDFALHDPLIDLLHVLNNQENNSKELKELLTLVNNQKNKLKQANEEIRSIALFPTKNPDPLIRIDVEGNIINRNPASEKLTSLVYEGKQYETNDFFKFIIHKIDLDEQRFTFEAKTETKDYSFICKSLKEEGYVNIYGRDITEQKKDQAELRRLSLVASINENGIVFTHPNGKIFWCNDSYLKLTGYSKEEVLGKTPIEIGKTEGTGPEEVLKMITPFFKGEAFDLEHLHRKKNGDNFWVKTKGQPIKDDKRQVVQYFAMIEDISLKKKYEEILKNERNKYSSIIANMNLGLLEVDKEDTITLVNQSFCDMSGFGIEDLIGQKAGEVFLSDEAKNIIDSKNVIRDKGVSDSYEIKVFNKKGEPKQWMISEAPNYDVNGEIIGSIGIHLDITEQKEQEEQLYLLSLIADKNINAVIISDARGRIEWANKSFLEMSGYEINEIIGQKPGALLQGKETNPETVRYLSDRVAKGLPFNCEIINYSKKGEKYWVNVNGQALYNKDGEIIKFFAIEENVTQKKEFEVQREFLVDSLAKSNKELEDYASIVSHDLKSPLRSIHSLISWIKEDNDKEFNTQTLQYLSMIENKVEKMDHLIEGILTYAKIDKADNTLESVNTQEIVQNIINIIYIPSHITVSIKNQLPIIKADRFRIQQLFQNLISNAVNYVDKPVGIVTIDCQETAKNYLFSVTDNGPGIAKENQEKIFKIFQSLETTDKSTGLGLSIVKKIVETYQGKIWIESKMSIGTTFFIKLDKP